MITEDYVSFEVAKLLKEKGFNEKPISSINYFKGGMYPIDGMVRTMTEDISIPLQSIAMKWLREEHNKIIVPSIRVIDPITGIIDCYCIGIYYTPKNNGGALCFISPTPENGYSSYEEACEAGIKYCLENLMNK